MSRRLGRGLDILLETVSGKEEKAVVEVEIERIRRNPFQPRANPEENIEELVESVKACGIIEPVILRPRGNEYEIVAGERRLIAAKRAGLRTVPAVVRNIDDRDMLVFALVENLQRKDLNPIEEALGIKRLCEEFSLTHEEVAKVLGKSRSDVSNTLRLLSLPKEIRELVAKGLLSKGHAKVLASLPKERAVELAMLAVEKDLSVRELEALAKRAVKATAKAGVREEKSRVSQEAEKLSKVLGAKVRIHKGKKTVRVEISVEADKFESLISRLLSIYGVSTPSKD